MFHNIIQKYQNWAKHSFYVPFCLFRVRIVCRIWSFLTCSAGGQTALLKSHESLKRHSYEKKSLRCCDAIVSWHKLAEGMSWKSSPAAVAYNVRLQSQTLFKCGSITRANKACIWHRTNFPNFTWHHAGDIVAERQKPHTTSHPHVWQRSLANS